MEAIIQTALITLAAALLLLPATLIVLGLTRMREKSPAGSWSLIGAGGLILCLLSLDILVTILVGRLAGPEALARYAIYSAYGSDALSYIALVMLGWGMARYADRVPVSL